MADLTALRQAWLSEPPGLNYKIAPAIGEAPNYRIMPDGSLDYLYLVTLAKKWNYASGVGKKMPLAKISAEPAMTMSGEFAGNKWIEKKTRNLFCACTAPEQCDLLGSKTRRHISCFQGLTDPPFEAI